MSSVYVITGASRGIGLEFVRQIAAKGNTVFACARNPDASEGLQKLVDNKKVFSVKLDTTNEESLKAAVKEIEKHASEGIDVLINNAGIGSKSSINPETVSKSDLLKTFETNVCGTSEATQAFLPLLRKRGQDKVKKIVNISSILGSLAKINEINPNGGVVDYNISKTALNMLTRVTAHVLEKENFIVYASHPGWVKTDMGGDGAPVEPQDSVSGQLAKIENATVKDNGGYFDFEGNVLPW
ncbi:4-dihydrotrisporin dehydrogenase [Gilbertella persicaria]|uniref:4-dihydrotrisporin dehydrogenase n=1 Tax=Gilbertella persicaria TaxID=101096 RepID=UPI00221E8DE9|nr:4-dihydrotrisporin dehydrogenase [Gilbertella persicaria]KAI8051899.1 4-dihydrotrisporin dehydrogenase [Gilbertella persicaria]